jgi:GntR family transcriptional regulator
MVLVKQQGATVFVFRLDTHSGVPPYLQLVQQVRQAVLLGFLQPGDRLPLIREVVEDLAINPNTVAKAYRQMEQENLVTGRPGQGTFVNEQQSAAMSASTYTSLSRGLPRRAGGQRAFYFRPPADEE